MKSDSTTSILMLCGSLEPGRDGVGDYTRRLAKALNLSGVKTTMLALADKQAETPAEEVQADVPAIRLPYSASLKQKMEQLAKLIQREQPEHVVLQYVPFSFHPKGLADSLLKALYHELNGLPIHWMCHEIWCGLSTQSGIKERLLGALQRRILRKYLRHASSISTSNPDYQQRLSTITTLPVQLLPLFGNIPCSHALSAAECKAVRDQILPLENDNALIFLIFGRIAPDFPAQAFLQFLDQQLERAGRQGCIVSIGRIDRGEAAWQSLAKSPYSNLSFVRAGEMSEDEVDRVIQAVDFGIATTPLEGIGKSGSSMAILERGKPMLGHFLQKQTLGLCPNQFAKGQVIDYRYLQPERLKTPLTYCPQDQLPLVAQKLRTSLGIQ
ncbi:glycosyltransferase [Cerasicoccus maritimus]|uniref:glycosyltransferase n=1 Tax=Cerasicoccus maritimus TaxID=490089 RepID=UPI002852AE7C|nr:glycosyltransferase [Cerasicoccus maritimus]